MDTVNEVSEKLEKATGGKEFAKRVKENAEKSKFIKTYPYKNYNT